MKKLVLVTAVLAMMVMIAGSVMAQEVSPQLQEWLVLGDLDALDARGNGFVFRADKTVTVTIPGYLEKVDTPKGSFYPGEQFRFRRGQKTTLWFLQPQLAGAGYGGYTTAAPKNLTDFRQLGEVQKLSKSGGKGYKFYPSAPVEIVVPKALNKIDTPHGSYISGQTLLLDGEATLWFW